MFFDKAKLFLNKHSYELWLIIVILFALYPLSIFLYIPKWDNVDAYLPYRYFISDYIRHGYMPFWNPFQYYGYPAYADLQGGCWYPVVWFLMLFGTYDITSLIIELLFCHLIAGLGMFSLSHYMHKDKKVAFILALSYGLSGFMIGSAQLMVFLIGVAWLPWCILFVLKFLHTRKWSALIWAALCIALQITGASPAYTIILIYIIIGLFVYHGLIHWSNKKILTHIFAGSFVLLITIVLLILPYIMSFWDFYPYFNRAEKLTYQGFLLQNPFTFAHYISFVFPYTILSDADLFKDTDMSLRNAYIGLLTIFAFVVGAFKYKKNKKVFFPLLCVVIISLALALGHTFVLYKYAYYLPGFGFFRHPSFFRVYAMFGILLIAGYALKDIIQRGSFTIVEKRIFWVCLILIILSTFFSLFQTSLNEVGFNLRELVDKVEFRKSDFYSHLFLNGFILLITIFTMVVLKKYAKLSLWKVLCLFMVIDMTVQVHLSAPSTLYYDISYKDMKTFFSSLPKTHSQTYNTTAFKHLDDTQGLQSTKGVWRNLGTLNKTISATGHNPLRFKAYEETLKNNLIENIAERPLISFAQKDSSVINESKISDILVGYNTFKADIFNPHNTDLVCILNQNYHHLWTAYINNNKVAIDIFDNMVMGVTIPAGFNGKIVFRYNAPHIKWALLISLSAYFLVFLWLIKNRSKSL